MPCDSRSLIIGARSLRGEAVHLSKKLESELSNVRSGGSRKEEFSW
jgi:hypothetical protein